MLRKDNSNSTDILKFFFFCCILSYYTLAATRRHQSESKLEMGWVDTLSTLISCYNSQFCGLLFFYSTVYFDSWQSKLFVLGHANLLRNYAC